MNTKTIVASSLVAIAALVAAAPAFAQIDASVGVKASVNANVDGRGPGMKGEVRGEARGNMSATTTRPWIGSTTMMQKNGDRRENATDRGYAMIDARVDSLNKLLARIDGMKKVSDTEKSSLEVSLKAQISALTSLKAEIDAGVATSTLKDDLNSITKSFRIYALIRPQAEIAAASDRILSIVTMLDTIQTKVQTRVSASATTSADVTIKASLADATAKIADATAQANAAISLTAGLKPDNGDATIAASNTAALKDAHAKIVAGQTDLKAAQADFEAVIKVIFKK